LFFFEQCNKANTMKSTSNSKTFNALTVTCHQMSITEMWYGNLHWEPYHLKKWYGFGRVCRIGSGANGVYEPYLSNWLAVLLGK